MNTGTLNLGVGEETSDKPPSPARPISRGGAFVVVGARESRVQGEGRQSMSREAQAVGGSDVYRH